MVTVIRQRRRRLLRMCLLMEVLRVYGLAVGEMNQERTSRPSFSETRQDKTSHYTRFDCVGVLLSGHTTLRLISSSLRICEYRQLLNSSHRMGTYAPSKLGTRLFQMLSRV
ncbi:hypothetical protein F5X96DRAFT_642731 [Biscogniauxia mediterranea]|nr:hypothetical protein F5X96DRAFT_642731 [Biscogniauxia mediterranea]